jgi:hypothetical protein
MFLEYSATWDALIGSYDGKYTYWTIRPSQADPGITLPISLPNHPSYPSNHATIDGALAEILEAEFPAETKRLEQIAEEAAISRLYGGIHYRFDKDAGLALGRVTAAKAMTADLASVPVVP